MGHGRSRCCTAFAGFPTPIVALGGGHLGVAGHLLHRRDVGADVEEVATAAAPVVLAHRVWAGHENLAVEPA